MSALVYSVGEHLRRIVFTLSMRAVLRGRRLVEQQGKRKTRAYQLNNERRMPQVEKREGELK